MLSGLGKIVRYYSYYHRGFNLTKSLILSSGYFNSKERNVKLSNYDKQRVREAQDLTSLVKAVSEYTTAFL